jgi:hypothetical protein
MQNIISRVLGKNNLKIILGFFSVVRGFKKNNRGERSGSKWANE